MHVDAPSSAGLVALECLLKGVCTAHVAQSWEELLQEKGIWSE